MTKKSKKPRKSPEERFRERLIRTQDGCLVFTGCVDCYGYGQVQVNRKRFRAHRFAFQLHHGREPSSQLMHTCDNPPCCDVNHLRECTHLENHRDKQQKGRALGKTAPRLRAEHALEIRRRRREYGHTYIRLAKDFDVTQRTIWCVITRRTWRHLPDEVGSAS